MCVCVFVSQILAVSTNRCQKTLSEVGKKKEVGCEGWSVFGRGKEQDAFVVTIGSPLHHTQPHFGGKEEEEEEMVRGRQKGG